MFVLNAEHFILVKVKPHGNFTILTAVHCIPDNIIRYLMRYFNSVHLLLTWHIAVPRGRSQHSALSAVGYFFPSPVKLQHTVDRIYFIDTMKRFQIGFWIRDVIKSTHDCLRVQRRLACRAFPFPISDDYFAVRYRVLIPVRILKHEAWRFCWHQ